MQPAGVYQRTMSRPMTPLGSQELYPEDVAYAYPASGKSWTRFSPLAVFLALSAFAVAMLCAVPIWNMFMILQNPMLSYLLGTRLARTFVGVTIAVVALYLIFGLGFFSTARPEVQTWQTLAMIATSMMVLLGVIFVLFAHPLREQSAEVGQALASNCAYSQTTSQLFLEYERLRGMRQDPTCAGLHSIEACPGYKATEEALAIKHVEKRYRCSGFCDANLAAVSANATDPLAPPPPALFSDTLYPSSCDASVARILQLSVADMATQIHGQGIGLILAAVLVASLDLASMCGPGAKELYAKPRALDSPRSYGATAY